VFTHALARATWALFFVGGATVLLTIVQVFFSQLASSDDTLVVIRVGGAGRVFVTGSKFETNAPQNRTRDWKSSASSAIIAGLGHRGDKGAEESRVCRGEP
jgi:hypothetical protein